LSENGAASLRREMVNFVRQRAGRLLDAIVEFMSVADT